MAKEEYVELHAASAFSFLEGASLPEALVDRAVELEMSTLAVMDRNGLYGAARFHTFAKKRGLKARIGAEIAVSDFCVGPRGRPLQRLLPPRWQPNRFVTEPVRIPLLCASQVGYQNLSQTLQPIVAPVLDQPASLQRLHRLSFADENRIELLTPDRDERSTKNHNWES